MGRLFHASAMPYARPKGLLSRTGLHWYLCHSALLVLVISELGQCIRLLETPAALVREGTDFFLQLFKLSFEKAPAVTHRLCL